MPGGSEYERGPTSLQVVGVQRTTEKDPKLPFVPETGIEVGVRVGYDGGFDLRSGPGVGFGVVREEGLVFVTSELCPGHRARSTGVTGESLVTGVSHLHPTPRGNTVVTGGVDDPGSFGVLRCKSSQRVHPS